MSLSKFIFDFEKTTGFIISDDQVNGIELLVKDYLHELLQAVGKADERFTASPVLPAGSFYEKTRVSHLPDEFDFITRLTKLSHDISFEPGCNGYSRIKVVRNGDKWVEFCQKGYLLAENYNEVVGKEQAGYNMMDRFYKLVLDAVNSGIKTFRGKYGTVELERMESSARGGIEFNLNYKYAAGDLPRDVYNSTMTSCTINVDLVPVIQFTDVSNVGKFIKSYPSEFNEIVKNHGCFLVPKSCTSRRAYHQCWRFTFSRPEMALMYGMDENHKICYRVLKTMYIPTKKYVHTQGHLCSYVLKTAMLHHYKCCRLKKSASVENCIIEVLDYLISRCKQFFIPCFFDNDLNIFQVMTVPIDKEGRQSGDIKYLSEKKDGTRFVAIICRNVCKTPIVHVRWGLFMSKMVDLVKGILLVIDNIELEKYDFERFAKWIKAMHRRVKQFFDTSEGETDTEFLHKLNIRAKVDEEELIGFSALVETIEMDMLKAIPIHHDKVKWLFDHILRENLIPKEATPPGWLIVNLSLTPYYTETTWRTYLRDPKSYNTVKANCTIDFFNHSGIKTGHDIYFTATETIQEGDELHVKFGSVNGAYDREQKSAFIGDVTLDEYLLRKEDQTKKKKGIKKNKEKKMKKMKREEEKEEKEEEDETKEENEESTT